MIEDELLALALHLGVDRVHAHLLGVAVLGKERAAHVLGPVVAELAHVLLAAETRPRAHRPTRPDRLRIVGHADGRVHGAEEEAQLFGAVYLHQSPELVRLK